MLKPAVVKVLRQPDGKIVSVTHGNLMARLAGMTLRERWNDWDRAPFTSESGKHISVWEKAR